MDMRPGQRVEVLWHRGMADEWYPGTVLEGGRVEIDDPGLFVIAGSVVLEPEEIAEWRPIALG